MTMLKLYIANKNYSSWSLRPWLQMKQLGIPFEERLVPFSGADGAPDFRAFSPTGCVPCLVDNQQIIWDSLAITEYLAEAHAEVWPAGKLARAWSRSAAAEMHSGFATVRNICGMNCGLHVRLHEWPAALIEEWRRIDELWCEGLQRFGGPFLGGAVFSAADAFFAPVAFRVQSYAPGLSNEAMHYAQRLLDLAAMCDGYAAALVESWREEAHETESRAVGVWLQDRRIKSDR